MAKLVWRVKLVTELLAGERTEARSRESNAMTWACGHWTHGLDSVSWFSMLWRGGFRACVYIETGVSGTSVTASSCFGIEMLSFFSNTVSLPAIFVR
jgi:hypothetical protein